MLDKRFSVVLKLSTVRWCANEIFDGDNFVIQTWRHTTETTNGSPAQREMRFSVSLSASLCADFEITNYLPKLGGLDRTNGQI